MKKNLFLFIFASLMLCFSALTASHCQEKTYLSQLYEINDPSIRELRHDKYYLNSERVHIAENAITLQSDFLGPIVLQNIFQDRDGIYTVGLYRIYQCNGCPRKYNSPPSKCECGSTSFTPIDLLD